MTQRREVQEAALAVALGAVFLALGATPLWSAVLMLWTGMAMFTVRRLRQRVFLTAFLLAFFIFLMSAETLRQLFDYRPRDYPPASGTHLSVTVLIGLSAIWLAYGAWPWVLDRLRDRPRGRHHEPRLAMAPLLDAPWVARAALIGFWVCVPAAYYVTARQIQVVMDVGYAGSYVAGAGGSGILDVVAGQLELMMTVFFVVFLATFPGLRAFVAPTVAWSLYLVLTLATGQRSHLVLGALFLICYVIVRSRESGEEGWFGRRTRLSLAVGAPAALVGLIAIESLRGVGGSYSSRLLTSFTDFFYNQGVSASAIRNAYIYEDRIPVQPYLLEFLHSGWVARLVGLPVSTGNSVERATEQASFSHALSYVVLGDGYFEGLGTGSSFLAELYFSLGYVGVAAGSLVLGVLLCWVENLHRGDLLPNIGRLLIVQDLLWAPRGSATGFLTTLLAPSTIAAVAAVLIAAPILMRLEPRVPQPLRALARRTS